MGRAEPGRRTGRGLPGDRASSPAPALRCSTIRCDSRFGAGPKSTCSATPGPNRGRAERRGTTLRVSTASLGDDELRALIERWYRREAATHLAGRVEHYSPRLDVRPSKVSIRGQRSRWGSCSGKGTVSLNWRLMMVPGELVDYVVVHELCHLRHMDHSPQFWALVGGTIPDYRQRRRRAQRIPEPISAVDNVVVTLDQGEPPSCLTSLTPSPSLQQSKGKRVRRISAEIFRRARMKVASVVAAHELSTLGSRRRTTSRRYAEIGKACTAFVSTINGACAFAGPTTAR